ncbi:MAG: heavy metal translocating P-type ATPase metal-binding domain-containing protein [Myxococcales bacterium]|nr:heavy metal translocating P-type ATPase metal-binding domain-containing protein [Myxococcales bacterium]
MASAPLALGPAIRATPAAPVALSDASCAHCGGVIDDPALAPYCCEGCGAVAALLRNEGLERYYDLRGGSAIAPARSAEAPRDLAWIEPLEERIRSAPGTLRVELDLQGIQCTACVWLLDELFRRAPGALRCEVNSGLGHVSMLVTKEFSLREYVTTAGRLGYRFGLPSKQSDREMPRRSGLVARLGVCAALAMNAMIFAIPLYLGLDSGPTYHAFRWISFGLATLSVIVGGSVFVRSAAVALRQRILHLDVPIALGIIAAWSGSALHHLKGMDGAAYFDTVAVFIALMLFGRWMQERAIERNRRMLLADDGVEKLPARRVRDDRVEVVRCAEIKSGDRMLVAPGEPVLVDGVLRDLEASVSLDWIQGESAPRPVLQRELVPAGAFNAGSRAITVEASTDFAASPLRALLGSAPRDDQARATPWWQTLARYYVLAVLTLATAGLVGWWYFAGLSRALEVVTAVLVVTCPCAFGLAAPLGYEIAQSGLRRVGLFVRTAGFLDRATKVRRVVFDKTGTVTTGALEVKDPSPLVALESEDRQTLFNLVARSSHPRATAVRKALERLATGDASAATGAQEFNSLHFDSALDVVEHIGKGLEVTARGATYRLGSAPWTLGDGAEGERFGEGALVFTRTNPSGGAIETLAIVETDEVLRPDARREVAALEAEGYEVWLLSGDAPLRVARTACTLGIPEERAIGGCTPSDKRAWVEAHDRGDTLVVGDGVNDAPAVSLAFCAGTPAIDRPFLPARTDFYFTTAGLHPVRAALKTARILARTNARNLAAALAYNVLVVALALAGGMSPLLCAVIMPASTLVFLLATWVQLGGSNAPWK